MALVALSKKTIAVNVVLFSVATTTVCARLFVRRRKRVLLKADDFLAILVLIIACALCFLGVWAAATGLFGQQLQQMSKARYGDYSKVTFINVILTSVCFGLIKISVLLFYKRIFTTKQFNLIANVFIGLSASFILVMVFGQVFSNDPIDRWWNYPPGYDPFRNHKFTFKYPLWLVTMQVVNMTLDLAILILPLPQVQRLNMSTARKVSIQACFATGFFCVIASAIRLYWTIQIYRRGIGQVSQLNLTVIFGWNNIWNNIEVYSSITAACLPTLSPLITATGGFVETTKAMFSRTQLLFRSSRSSKDSALSSYQGRNGSHEHSSAAHMHHTTRNQSKGGYNISEYDVYTDINKSDESAQQRDCLEAGARNGIHVEREFIVSREDRCLSDQREH